MSEVPKHPWLSKRGNVYRVRAPVPQDIVKTFGKREVTYSLRTSELREACALIDGEAAKIRRRFDEHRIKQQPCAKSVNPASTHVALSPLELQQSCEKRYQHIVDEDFEWRFQFREQLEAVERNDVQWCDDVNERLRERSDSLFAQLVPLANISYLTD